jgi:hypothetical protein
VPKSENGLAQALSLYETHFAVVGVLAQATPTTSKNQIQI